MCGIIGHQFEAEDMASGMYKSQILEPPRGDGGRNGKWKLARTRDRFWAYCFGRGRDFDYDHGTWSD